MTTNGIGITLPPRRLYEEADRLNELYHLLRRAGVDSLTSAGVLDAGEALREIARQKIRSGIDY